MTIKSVLKEQRNLVKPDEKTLNYLEMYAKKVVGALKEEISGRRVDAQVFIGGSFAKGTLVESKDYDIDIFVRFAWKLEDLSSILEKIVKRVGKKVKLSVNKIHGSRDYFRLENDKVIFEIIPVHNIKKPQEARNVTDLSFFHVNYIRKKLVLGNLSEDIMLAKKFFQGQRIYGAESYINGFSGYGSECLVIHYGSFEKMLRELVKVKSGKRLILDTEKLFKRKGDVLFELNESKLHGPVILVDPTFKERNVLAALNNETFERFQDSARKFLKKPSGKYFFLADLDIEKLKKIKGEFLHLGLETDRQTGDIAGTKMKKFSRFLERELQRYFDILRSEFVYDSGRKADFYLVLRGKKEVVKIGPPLEMEGEVKKFRKVNRGVFEDKGRLYSREKIDFTGKEFLKKWLRKYGEKIKEMGVVGVGVK